MALLEQRGYQDDLQRSFAASTLLCFSINLATETSDTSVRVKFQASDYEEDVNKHSKGKRKVR